MRLSQTEGIETYVVEAAKRIQPIEQPQNETVKQTLAGIVLKRHHTPSIVVGEILIRLSTSDSAQSKLLSYVKSRFDALIYVETLSQEGDRSQRALEGFRAVPEAPPGVRLISKPGPFSENKGDSSQLFKYERKDSVAGVPSDLPDLLTRVRRI